MELKGKYNKDCIIFTDEVESTALSTIYSILNDEVSKDVPVRIMPDVHDGKDIVIGFTMPLTDRINPNHVGVDIGCGVLSVSIPMKSYILNHLTDLDTEIRKIIPMGFSHREFPVKLTGDDVFLEDLCKLSKKIGVDFGDVMRQVGTLGGGNHFIEIGTEEGKDTATIFIHSGSRNFGLQVCKYHSNKAKSGTSSKYLFGEDMQEYFEDMKLAQEFAKLNREVIAKDILQMLGVGYLFDAKSVGVIDTIHNYIDFTRNIIRKGAVSAEKDQLLSIPLNMRDGVLVCKGKGNPEWNYSAPHGAGRILSRSKAKESINLEDFEKSMEGIYSTSVVQSTLDESPFAYKDSSKIIEAIKDTVEIMGIVKPVLNIKSN